MPFQIPIGFVVLLEPGVWLAGWSEIWRTTDEEYANVYETPELAWESILRHGLMTRNGPLAWFPGARIEPRFQPRPECQKCGKEHAGIFVVWESNGPKPTKFHSCYETAKGRCMELSNLNPGRKFYVLAEVAAYEGKGERPRQHVCGSCNKTCRLSRLLECEGCLAMRCHACAQSQCERCA